MTPNRYETETLGNRIAELHRIVRREFPFVTRIAVALYDALTSARPYKEAWSDDAAVAFLTDTASTQFDPRCVAALVAARDEIADIRARFDDGSMSVTSHEGYAADI